ncbi:hypothetical protein PRUPE_5G011900 [Prunus persica]|uniref:Secreted protein n=1 Tax=Prunus persica TaxID=3760 RepID=A0A251P1T7_PRUPE|nr:hypothetical protein PRUPE_5G011900 [Prunus persica]
MARLTQPSSSVAAAAIVSFLSFVGGGQFARATCPCARDNSGGARMPMTWTLPSGRLRRTQKSPDGAASSDAGTLAHGFGCFPAPPSRRLRPRSRPSSSSASAGYELS